jgi:hypothetical protein
MLSSLHTNRLSSTNVISVQKKRNFNRNHIHTVSDNLETTEGQSEASQLPLDPGEQGEATGA